MKWRYNTSVIPYSGLFLWVEIFVGGNFCETLDRSSELIFVVLIQGADTPIDTIVRAATGVTKS